MSVTRGFRRKLVRAACTASLCLLTFPASAQSVAYDYDAVGRLTSATYADGTVIVYAYDVAGNRTSQTITLPAGTGPPNIPQSISPPNGAAEVMPSQTAQVAVSWQIPASGPAVHHYELQQALNSANFSSNLTTTSHAGSTTSANLTLLPASPANRYYFRVRACNAADQCSAWREFALWEIAAFLECTGCEPPPDG